jgi:hypothetical protein
MDLASLWADRAYGELHRLEPMNSFSLSIFLSTVRRYGALAVPSQTAYLELGVKDGSNDWLGSSWVRLIAVKLGSVEGLNMDL